LSSQHPIPLFPASVYNTPNTPRIDP